jgi:putative MFS transporter
MLFLIAAGLFVDSFANMVMPGVLAVLVHMGISNLSMNAYYISVTFAGLTLGALLAGLMGDRFGRKSAYQFNLLLFGVFSLLSAFMPNMWSLIFVRFFMSIGLGAEYAVGYGFVTEFVPPLVRGRCVAVVFTLSSAGTLAASLVSVIVIPAWGWRWMFVISGIMALAVWMLRKNMPDSPRWLESVGRLDEADALVRRIEKEAGITEAPTPARGEKIARPADAGVMELFRPRLVGRTVLAIVISMIVMAGIYSFVAWTPTFLIKQGFSMASSLWFSTLMITSSVAGPALAIWVSDTLGRKSSVTIAAVLAAVAAVIYPHLTSIWTITVCGFLLETALYLLLAFAVGIYVPELFPTQYRLRGSGIAQSAGRFAVMLSPYLVVLLFGRFGVSGVVYFIAGLCVFLCIIILTFGLETTRRSLEEIAS